MSCIFVFYLVVFSARAGATRDVIGVGPTAYVQSDAADPDALYAKRDIVAMAQGAAAIWQARLKQNPNDFESAWKLARATYWIGTQAPNVNERRPALEQGITAGHAATRIQPNRPEGHMWLAANMGALAESFGLRQGLKYRGEIKDELLTVVRLDPGYEQGSADRALGRWYYRVPGLFGGSNKKSEEHLRRSLTYNPNSTASLYFLAETLIAMKRKDEAKDALQRLLAVPIDPAWAAEDHNFKARASVLIKTLT
jgi:tetratricopeptide (TPR) repeat protein